ncbi:uncharacterized protein [Tiliqua scincoides]|uniref:uncharacterized protein n=1 Tax=Tiliqua scincoides TaxID=71010 RepID=UPI003462A6B2
MDVTFLGPIVILLHVAAQWASSADSLHAPILSVHHGHPTYFEGERVELICSAPPNRTAEGYRFFNQRGWQILETAPNVYQQGKLAFNVQMDSIGNYTCVYWMGRGGMDVTSAQSNIISLQVKEAPAAPLLSLDPSLDAYNLEDTVSLICSAPPETQKIKEFQYYGDRQTISVVASSPISMHNLSLKEPSHVTVPERDLLTVSWVY